MDLEKYFYERNPDISSDWCQETYIILCNGYYSAVKMYLEITANADVPVKSSYKDTSNDRIIVPDPGDFQIVI
ncbi:hypothetical protein STEG23_011136 [Scotinomys teguina]